MFKMLLSFVILCLLLLPMHTSYAATVPSLDLDDTITGSQAPSTPSGSGSEGGARPPVIKNPPSLFIDEPLTPATIPIKKSSGSNWWKWALGIAVVGIAAAAAGGGGGGGGNGGSTVSGTLSTGW